MDKRAVIRSVIAVLIFAAVLIGYKLYDIISHPQFYIYGNVVEADVDGSDIGRVKTADRHEIDVLLSCIRKVRINNDNPPGADGMFEFYDVVLTFADGSTLKYLYHTEESEIEPDPFGEFSRLFISGGQPDVIELYM